jgi:quercetin dioxygenase-like cupin family protein
MKKILWIILPLCMVAGAVTAENTIPAPINPVDLSWISPPGIPGVHIAWVLGAEQRTGLYSLRVKLDQGAMIPPHQHPDERNSTVLSGTLYVGFGDVIDESKLVAVKNGAVYIAPADVAHYLYAKDEDVVYQESGYGPTGTVVLTQPREE